jgi:hypothetical protein
VLLPEQGRRAAATASPHGESRADLIVSAPLEVKSDSGLRGDGPQMK